MPKLSRYALPGIIVVVLLAGGVGNWLSAGAKETAAAPVDFARDVYPLLRKTCFDCHGPDQQKGKLRLDTRRGAFHAEEIIVPGQPENSELVRRITLPRGDRDIMPARGEPLSAREIELIRSWIAQGAKWPADLQLTKHWAYIPPVRPLLPKVKDAAWPKNAIDFFILARLEQEGLKPSPEADKAALMRRVSLDLIGLPPAPEAVAAFLADPSPDAYEKLVDRLLHSPQFGVRWARPWLDLARYADSHGFQRDDLRDNWAYRDWVVNALNANMPFDQFTIEQMAGDLLPNATESQRIATGFHRCATTNVEAGSIPEETRINQIIDRVNTTATVWLGTTLECAQCHEHKYDPFTQKEYYQLLAFFNNTAIEADRSNPKVPGSIQFLGPTMTLSDPERDRERRQLQEDLAKLQQAAKDRQQELRADLDAWASGMVDSLVDKPATHILEIADVVSKEGATWKLLDDGSVLFLDDPPDRDTYIVTMHTDLTQMRAFKLEALTDDSLPGQGPGRGDPQRPNFVLNDFTVAAAPRETPKQNQPVRLVAAQASFSQQRFDVSQAIDQDPKTAWAINPRFGESHWAVFQADQPIGYDKGTTLTFTLIQNYGGGRTIGRLRLSAVTGKIGGQELPADVLAILKKPDLKWTPKDRDRLLAHRLAQDAKMTQLQRQSQQTQQALAALAPATTLVMQELPTPRQTFVFNRGDYRSPKEPVEPDTPAVLHPLPEGPRQRLTFARWLVSRDNPLAARVTVNRWWAEIFGHGIVRTVEDFGIQGEPPTHPELLDWLAMEFMDGPFSERANGELPRPWDMKHILKTIVLSATYRQSANLTPELLTRDDQNKLHARGPRFRMDAEMIRDNALAAAGLLSLQQGGPPIKPYQPDGIWTKVGGQRYDYIVSPGEMRYRRGLYVVWKRGSPYPSFINFDATNRLSCTVQRSRTNTPLQALTLLNDPVYVEAALALARRLLVEKPDATPDERLRHAFRLCMARQPDDKEVTILRDLFEEQFAVSKNNLIAAQKLVGNFSAPKDVPLPEFAAWYSVATVLLNLDETITK
ncbi:MAG: PSD1 and planctomycete cytochrome C domain-containing protein [Gemmataceae bacterium]